MARIAVGGFLHETNSFIAGRTDFAFFATKRDRPPLVRGQDVIEALSAPNFSLSGFLSAMQAEHQFVPLVWANGSAGAIVTRDAFERIAGELVGMLSRELPVDGVYLDLHGAMVCEDFEDGEGELLRRVRAAVGEQTPVVASLDYHANVTADMVRYSDGLIAYLTYPHVDQRQTGERSAKVLTTLLARGRPTGRALRKLPFLIPLNSQCTMLDPSKAIVAFAAGLETGDVLNAAYLAGFPPSDLAECGPAVAVHAYGQALADATADKLTAEIVRRESEFAAPLLDPDTAVREAIRIAAGARRPVVLADTQDNPGCGATSDTTGVLESLVRNKAQGAVLGFLCDPEAAAAAHAAGENASITLALGGKHGPDGVKPFHGTFRVTRLGDGRVRGTGPVAEGRSIDLGPMALLTLDGVSVVASSKRMQAYDQAPFRHLGVEPKDQKILVLKSTAHFRADFQAMAEEVLVVLAPGGHLVDATLYPYKRLRRGVRLDPLGPVFAGPAPVS